ncbi:NOT2 / NOT3 / NOT5 family protein [Brugia malayi]|uniref:Bm10341 n=1 Tax=Brugia malayi TaxID=6279 RepID=A0A1P6CE90_BRUMA|nr:NOT2 / NOT3 / NOT5 family protein [Brugia malayi]CDP97656.1 Bm10341 [Brugia malayi]VIO93176.1 NOT2 / NOT3 / NOT5 family protein [Brugia malayi]
MEQESEKSPRQSPTKTDFQIRNEDFPTLQSTLSSRGKRRGKNKGKSRRITDNPSKTMGKPSETISEASRIMGEPSGIASESSKIMGEPSGTVTVGEPSGIASESSKTMGEPSETVGEPSKTVGEPSAVISDPSKIMSKPSGIINDPSGAVNEPSRIRMPVAGTSTLQDFQPESKPKIEIYPDGTVTNIPSTMLTDQFGMIGYLSAYRGMQLDSALSTVLIGENPLEIGLGMNSKLEVPDPSGHGRREIHQNYGGPWAKRPNHAPHIEVKIPEVYKLNSLIGDKLAQMKFSLLEEDALFYIFYNYPGEQYQIAAAYGLYGKEWRYHKVERLWVRRFSYESVTEQTNTFEKGTYYVFDSVHWRKMPRKMTIEYKDLESRVEIPPDMRHLFD